MKKLILILIPMLLVIGLSAIEFDISGENRTRAAFYNDPAEKDGGHIDNRLNIGLDSQLHRNLNFRFAVQIGDTTWGNGGGGIGTGERVHVTEAYLDYMIDSFDARIKLGQMYWMDRMGLVMDDYFSGLAISKTFGDNLNTELIWVKKAENVETASDDSDVFIFHAMVDNEMPIGAYLMFGNYEVADYQNLTVMPYLAMEKDALSLDATVFMDMQMGADTEMGFGGAAKAKLDMTAFELGADVLVASEHGLTTISPWYQNGLYIYGIGKYHDGLNQYWGVPYQGNTDLFASIVGNIKAPLKEKLDVFAAAGYLMDLGFEVNAGLECTLIPDLFHMQVYGAYGIHDDEINNYALGSSLKIEF
ncbi:MAG: hypothetical protein RBR69_03070 [Candidatus Cloacimonadaceae bacterium]|jgi:hypothetical protein|nr:hypothetical protein [Candidatus Cloacimonadota bacterium]MDY0127098.1 hypothetical protein [Candidatus Cloacimonadaceae bacterium]MCB5255707.1 hypothetical protein [Candidatus Cloacimonadota bacterium]MCK9177781.1 hypothetical protein [Candidatus Cloacimonadota bacterium]MCK9241745.1 hypothetical protein [Candidatus Cloacimonadota bacterium]